MLETYKKLIEEHQASSLKRVLQVALEYHFSNFKKLEELAEPYSVKDRMGITSVAVRIRANSEIKLEVQAYINQLRRLKHFINYLQKHGGFEASTDPELKQVWNDIMERNGVVNLLANKWASHRSVDDPKEEESDALHLEVLLNLESTITTWGNGHLCLQIKNYSFYLFHYHHKALKFIDWVFEAIESNPHH